MSLFEIGLSSSKLTSFFSIDYLIFFLPVVVLGYAVLPQKLRRIWLMAGSVSYFFLISKKQTIWLLLTIAVVYAAGCILGWLYARRDKAVKAAEKSQRKAIKAQYHTYARVVMLFAAVSQIGILLMLKYTGFFEENLNAWFGTSFSFHRFTVPIGVSFYTLQAVSYIMDVYREVIPADRNPGRVGLFMTFFPQIVEGPICRYSQTAHQLWEAKPITYENLTFGTQRILYGLMKKMVVADRLNSFVANIFDVPGAEGGVVALGALAYTIQLYMDFSGSMDAVIGVAQIFGVTMPENFKRPFFSRTISEFWNRWHISLGAFFKDFIFYPVTMAKSMKKLTTAARKKIGNHYGPLVVGAIALFCVWSCNGLWHGAAWSYIFFGMYHFVLILLGNFSQPIVRPLYEKFHLDPECRPWKCFQIIRTCILVLIGELFFRAKDLTTGMNLFGKMVTDFRFTTWNGELMAQLAIDTQDIVIVAVTLVIVFCVSLANERGIVVRDVINRQKLPVRWLIWYGLILYIVIFGAYGGNYTPVDPMYANF